MCIQGSDTFFYKRPCHVLLVFDGAFTFYNGREYPVFFPVLATYGPVVYCLRACTDFRFAKELTIWPKSDDLELITKLSQISIICDPPFYYVNFNAFSVYRYQPYIYFPIVPPPPAVITEISQAWPGLV